MSSLSELMEAHSRALREFEERFGIRAGGGEVLELRPDPSEPGVLLVRMRIGAEAPARPAPAAPPPVAIAQPAPAVWREAADEAFPVRGTPGVLEEATELIAREEARLRLAGRPGGGFGLPLLAPEERARLLAYGLIGDVLGGLQTRHVVLDSPLSVAELRAAEQAFADETARLGLAAQPRLFHEALAQQAPPETVRAFTSHA
ncbi:MAG TPA: hypothetical protein VGB66_02995 [Longimicrobium sp.]|jgi:hypothetical protein